MDDWKNVFGEVPDSFQKSMRAALSRIKEREVMQHKIIKRSKLRAVLIATLVLLLGTTAYAAALHFGVISFFDRGGKQLPENAQCIIQTAVPQQTPEAALVAFSIREAVYDAEQFYVVVEARPVDADKYLLLCMDAMPDDPAGNMGIEDTGATLKELAAQQGKKLLQVGAGIFLGDQYVMDTADYVTEADGTVVMMLSGKGMGNAGAQQFTCKTTVTHYDENGSILMDRVERANLPFTLRAASAGDITVYKQQQPSIVEGTGVRVERVELKRTALDIYAELYYTIDPSATKEEKALVADGLWFEYLDSDGNRLADGLRGTGSIEETGDGSFVQKTSLASMETLPSSITIRAFDCWEKTRYGSITLEKTSN